MSIASSFKYLKRIEYLGVASKSCVKYAELLSSEHIVHGSNTDMLQSSTYIHTKSIKIEIKNKKQSRKETI